MNYKDTLMWKEIGGYGLLDAALKENSAAVKEIAAQVKSKKIDVVYAVGRGTSDHALVYFKYLTEVTAGIPVALGACSVVTMYNGKLDLSHALVIGVSQSGRAEDVIGVIKNAKNSGAVTAVITNDKNSPLSKCADYSLYCACGEEKSVAATKTFTSQLFVLTMLANALGEGKYTGLIENLKDSLAKAFPAADEITDRLSAKIKDFDEGFVLARGASSALAFECGLKLQETSYMRMRAYHISDFYHGPMAMVTDGACVIVFVSRKDLDGKVTEERGADADRCIRQLLSLGADVHVITDDNELALKFPQADVNILPCAENEAEAVFFFALTAQTLACKTSCARGLNPDSPRALKKVTVTV